jgi:transcriptional regulator with XRE-family HTH domain/mannose-6-phosphate isomerase-like protein (cupin superfamily)
MTEQGRATEPTAGRHDQRPVKEMSAPDQIGRRLREARMARGISLREMARRINVSPSFVSQMERGKANPSVGTLYAFVNELGASLDELTSEPADPGQVDANQVTAPVAGLGVAADITGGEQMSWDPRTVAWPRIGAPVQRAPGRRRIQLSGVVWERLTHDDDPYTDFLHVHYAPGSASCPENDMMRHGGREYGYIISGRIDIQIGFDLYHLEPGDSIHFDSTTPHRLSNPYDEPCTGIWVVIARREDNRVTGNPVAASSSHLPGLL